MPSPFTVLPSPFTVLPSPLTVLVTPLTTVDAVRDGEGREAVPWAEPDAGGAEPPPAVPGAPGAEPPWRRRVVPGCAAVLCDPAKLIALGPLADEAWVRAVLAAVAETGAPALPVLEDTRRAEGDAA